MADDLVQDWRVQVNLKSGPGYEATLVNVRADDFEEMNDLLKQINGDVAANIANAAALIQTTTAVAGQLGGEQPVASATQTSTQQAPPSNSGSNKPQCAHGERVYRKAKAGASNQWEAYFCNTPQNAPNKCDPIFKGKDNESEPYWP